MNTVPWYLGSPSVMTIGFYGLLSLWGALRFKPHSFKQWCAAISDAVFILGLVVLPMDLMWSSFQEVRFQSLFPQDISLIVAINRDIIALFLCYLLTRKFFKADGILNWKSLLQLTIYIEYFTFHFIMAPDPSWTDYTYGIRFGYPIQQIVLQYVLCGIPSKALQGLIYYGLWKKPKMAPILEI